jgi:predicted porin
MFYESPVFSGVQAKLAIQPNKTKATDTTSVNENPSAWSGSIAWTGMGGRARAFLANMRAKDWSSVGNTDNGYTFGGGYNFGPVDVGATYENYTYKVGGVGGGDVKAKQYAFGIAVPLGSGKIGASYARAKSLTGGPVSTPGFPDTGAKMYNIGYEWALSKRTALGFGYAKITNDAGAAFTWTGQTAGTNGPSERVGLGQSQSNLFVSMRHSF